MKTTIYTITYTSYTQHDNYLYNEVRTTDNRVDAIKLYEEWRNNARADAKGEDDEYDIEQVETLLTEKSRKYQVSREVGTEDGYQAIIELSTTEL